MGQTEELFLHEEVVLLALTDEAMQAAVMVACIMPAIMTSVITTTTR